MVALPNSKTNTICISHAKDADGIVCAALIKAVKQAQYLLTNYDEINNCLTSIEKTYTAVYVCDLAINNTMVNEFARIQQYANLTYIDHHLIERKILRRLQKSGITIIHNRSDCASMLTYYLFQTALPREAELLAIYAAIADRLEHGAVAQPLFQRHDHNFILFEGTLLSFALEKTTLDEKKQIVELLSQFEYPHRIPGVMNLACDHAERIAVQRRDLSKRIYRIGKLIYATAGDDPTETIANLLVELYAAPISVSYHINKQRHIAELSIRGSTDFQKNLGKIVATLAQSFAGTGGGHPKICGAIIPASKLKEFLYALSLSAKQ